MKGTLYGVEDGLKLSGTKVLMKVGKKMLQIRKKCKAGIPFFLSVTDKEQYV